MFDLEQAWRWREKFGLFRTSEAMRVFHGPGEGHGDHQFFAVDRFGDHYWITEWETQTKSNRMKDALNALIEFYVKKGALSVVGLSRPESGIPTQSTAFYGKPPQSRMEIRENENRFWIQLEKTRHPGLFLDHEPLRNWLSRFVQGLRVLNTFAYTGSLSVAAARGRASHVTTLDLSKPSIQWAKDNFLLNGLSLDDHRFIFGDVFEWLPRFKKEKEKFDCIILDPPSFSHGKKGKFSTSKDLERLHALSMDLLSHEGLLITSINSANITWKKYETDVFSAAKSKGMKFSVLQQIDLPETFPTPFSQNESRYLKGWILRRS